MPSALADLDIEWFCCDISNFCVAEPQVFYMELVDPDICNAIDANLSADICDSNSFPTKDGICQLRENFEDTLSDFVMDLDALCGYTDEDGNVVESDTQPVCDSW